jgi:hypothetical protein
MVHLITLSGNSERFKRKNLGHKALCMVERETMVSHFVKSFPDFQDYESVFVCRDQDLKETTLKDEITRCAKGAAVYGIEKNDLGPVYSISKIFDRLPDTEPILVSYVDTLQNTSLAQIELDFKNFEGGLSVHDFNNPHWRTNQSYCFTMKICALKRLLKNLIFLLLISMRLELRALAVIITFQAGV